MTVNWRGVQFAKRIKNRKWFPIIDWTKYKHTCGHTMKIGIILAWLIGSQLTHADRMSRWWLFSHLKFSSFICSWWRLSLLIAQSTSTFPFFYRCLYASVYVCINYEILHFSNSDDFVWFSFIFRLIYHHNHRYSQVQKVFLVFCLCANK